MVQQLAFDWPAGVRQGPEDFFVAAANAQAFAMVTAPDSWPEAKLVLTGPTGCGKSHLVRVFQLTNDASVYRANALPTDPPPPGPVVVEDMQTLPADDQEAMFHLHNHQRHARMPLLMTAIAPPARWPLTLPDLASRMQATTIVKIDDPDDALLAALIMKLFADRQIMPQPELVAYLVPRIERSYASAADIVARIDDAALRLGQKINRNLARQLLDNAPDNA